jgi:hypothetical protein
MHAKIIECMGRFVSISITKKMPEVTLLVSLALT